VPSDDLSAFSRALRSILLDAGSAGYDGEDRKHCIRDYCACGNLLAMGIEAEMISISLAASARTGPSHRAEYATVASEGLKRRRAGLAIVEERDRSASSRRTNHRIRHRPESRVT
jgi:hypothetical protein